jgi:hypothetical protein
MSNQDFKEFADNRNSLADAALQAFVNERPEYASLLAADNPYAPENIGRILVEASAMPMSFSAVEIAVERLLERKELLDADGSPPRKYVQPLPPVELDKDFMNLISQWSQDDVDFLYANNDHKSEVIRKYELACATYPGLHRPRKAKAQVTVTDADLVEARRAYLSMDVRAIRRKYQKDPIFKAAVDRMAAANLI